jgi:hypothetical protein
MNDNKNNNKQYQRSFEQGRYCISPMSEPRHDGGFDAAVSIRSGRGMSSVDRVMRFTPLFASARDALRYARAEGLAWARCH